MSHEVIYDKLYPKGDRSPQSFDLTDSIISGLYSNSSQLEVPDKSEIKNNKFVESTDNKSESTKSTDNNLRYQQNNLELTKSQSTDSELTKSQSTDNESESTKSKSIDNESESMKSSSTDYKSEPTNNKLDLTDGEFDSIDSKFKPVNNKSKSVNNKFDSPTSVKKSSSCRSSDKSQRFRIANILPSRADPFVYDRKTKIIRYNFERCVYSDSSLVLGGNNNKLILDPSKSTLIVGQNNLSELNGSFITGENNKIKGKHSNKNNTIIGDNNELQNSTNSTIISCSGVKLKNCKETIALGIKATKDDVFPENLEQTLLVRNLHVAGNLSASSIRQNSVYVKGDQQKDVYYQITRGDGIDVVYVNPIDGPIWIQLGTSKDLGFEANRVIVIKDVTIEFGQTSANNVNIIVPPTEFGAPQIRIEYYDGKLLALSSDPLIGYVLNTAGGSVTYRYVNSFMPGQSNSWVIQNQFLGNSRVIPFPSTSEETRSKLIKKY